MVVYMLVYDGGRQKNPVNDVESLVPPLEAGEGEQGTWFGGKSYLRDWVASS